MFEQCRKRGADGEFMLDAELGELGKAGLIGDNPRTVEGHALWWYQYKLRQMFLFYEPG